MWTYLRHCRPYFVYAGVFSFFINLLLLTVPLYTLQVFDRVLSSRSQETLWVLTLTATVALSLYCIFEVLRGRLLLAGGVALDSLLGPPVMAGLLQQAVRPGDNPYRDGMRDVATVRGFLTGHSVAALFDAPWVPVYLGVIYLFHPLLGLVASGGAIALFLLAYLNELATRGPLQELQQTARQAGTLIDVAVSNAEVVHALGMRSALRKRWQRYHGAVSDSQLVAGRRSGVVSNLSKFARLLLQVIMLGVAAGLVIDQHVSAGVMIASTILLARALAPVEVAIGAWRGLVDARGAFRRLNRLLSTIRPAQPVALPQPKGQLQADQVVFTPPGHASPSLLGISFSLNAGTTLGVVGPSGAGKSTLARLLIGIWPADAGSVRLDGADVSQWPRKELGPHVGYLPQDVELFAGTVAENIARLGAAADQDIVTAAQRAHAHDFILRLPHGYDTELGEAGSLLSGGQRQRIGLARALFGDPRLVVLDEPNANLDSFGEQALQRAIVELKTGGTTVVVISHRAALLSAVDALLVLNDGRRTLFGPRDRVLAQLNEANHTATTPYVISGGKQ